MKHDRDLNMSIVHQLGEINRGTGEFVAGILYDKISAEEQIAFAAKLTSLATTINQRATGETGKGSVIEGEIQDDRCTSDASSADRSDS